MADTSIKENVSNYRMLKHLFPLLMLSILLAACSSSPEGTQSIDLEVESTERAISVSTTPERKNAQTLDAATMDGSVYVYIADKTVEEAAFYLDDPERKGEPYNVENSGDLGLEPGDGLFDTTQLSDGVHTLTAVLKKDAKTRVVTSSFLVDNSANWRRQILVSNSPKRTEASLLEGQQVEGTIYVYVMPNGLSEVRPEQITFSLDDETYQAQNGPSIERYPFYDFARTAVDGAAQGFDTTTLSDGEHTISAELSWGEGKTELIKAAFKVGEGDTGQGRYVAPGGDDTNPGTLERPFGTIQHAADLAQPGDTIYLRGGVYRPAPQMSIRLRNSGTPDAPIRLFAYADEQPIIDASAWPRLNGTSSDDRKPVIRQYGDWWHVRGLTVRNGPWVGYRCQECDHSVWEALESHDHGNSGFSIFGEASDNLLLNCDLHHNFDRIGKGQDADGLAIHFGSGKGNVVRGCRIYNNADDGLDFWQFTDPVLVEETWAFGNGVDRWNFGPDFEGNGNGFKLGGGRPEVPSAAHVVRRSLAWGNPRCGFDYNGNKGALEITSNTAFDNGYSGFCFRKGSAKLRNNLSVNSGKVQTGDVNDAHNAWTLDVTAEVNDFASVDKRLALNPRGAGGALPKNSFLRLADGSDLIDEGVKTGLPFTGAAPDLGAYERGE